jgi:hypothetical protein
VCVCGRGERGEAGDKMDEQYNVMYLKQVCMWVCGMHQERPGREVPKLRGHKLKHTGPHKVHQEELGHREHLCPVSVGF